MPEATPGLVTSGALWIGWGHAALCWSDANGLGKTILKKRRVELAGVLLARNFFFEMVMLVVKQI